MRRFALGLLFSLTVGAASVRAQELGDMAALRHALSIDPFAVTPYRILSGRLTAQARTKLLDELSAGPFAAQVLAARLQIDAGQAGAARARLHQSAGQLPADARTLDAFAQLALSAGAYPEAATAATAALKVGRTPPRLIEAAIAELRQGRHKEGLALLAELRTKDATGVASEAALDALLAQRMIAEAVELLRAQLEPRAGQVGTTGTVQQWRQLADLERQLGHVDAANTSLLSALDVEPSATGRRALAQAVMHANHDKKALAALELALKTAKTAPRLVLRGDTQVALGKSAQAAESYAAAAKADPTDPEPELRLAATAKTPAERAQRYAVLVAAHPTDLRYALELADLRFAAKDDAGGKQALRDAAEHLSAAPSAQEQLARRLTEHGDMVGALQCRKRAAQLDPRNADFAFALADAYRAAGDRAAALTAYDQAFERTDGGRAAWDRILDSLERAGYTAEADQRFVAARKKWPADGALARRHATALERNNELGRALVVWQQLARDSQRPFDKEQAAYNVNRLQNRQATEK